MSRTHHHVNWRHHAKRYQLNNSRIRKMYFHSPLRRASRDALREVQLDDKEEFLIDQRRHRRFSYVLWL